MNRETISSALPLLFLSLFLCQACAASSATTAQFTDRLPPCPDTPNCLNSEDPAEHARIAPLTYSGSSALAWQKLKKAVTATGGKIGEEREGYLRAVYTSMIFRFKDDVEFRLDEATKMIQVRSASRIGYWDFGTNRRRVERIRKLFERNPEGR